MHNEFGELQWLDDFIKRERSERMDSVGVDVDLGVRKEERELRCEMAELLNFLTVVKERLTRNEIEDVPSFFYEADCLANYSFVFPFEASWSRRRANDWVRRNWTLSIWASIVYVLLILIGERLMRRRERPFELRRALTTWNVALAIFSIVGFARTTPEFVRTLSTHGFVHSVCQSTYAQDIVFDFWLIAFVGSKFVELFDTAFIVLRKRPLTFLHCYHHVTVLLYCWHGGKELTAAGRWFCWMNYGVHSIMYTYYAARSLGYRLPRAFSISLTSLQISQMIAGCCIVRTVYRTKSDAWHAGEDSDRACRQSWDNLYFCFAIYFSYFCLFLRFFVRAYVLRPAIIVAESASTAAVASEEKQTERDAAIHREGIGNGQTDKFNGGDLRYRRASKRAAALAKARRMQTIIEQFYNDKEKEKEHKRQ